MHKGHYGHYSGNSKFSKRHDEDYDAKEAYNKNLTASARLHYLENDRHDHESPAKNIVGMAGKALKSAKKAATTVKVQDFNQRMKDSGAPDDYNVGKNQFYRNELRKKGIQTFHAVPWGEENHQWDGNEWKSPSPATNIVGMAGKAAGMAADAAQGYKLAQQREAMKKALEYANSSMGDFLHSHVTKKSIGEAGQKLLKGSKAIGQKRRKLKAGPDTNYNRRDKDSYFYDEDYAADAGPAPTREELQNQRNEAIKAKINKQN